MIPCGVIIDELHTQMTNPRDTADVTYKKQVFQKLNEAYRDVCGSFPWTGLQKTTTLTDDSFIVPSDCRTIMRVYDDDKLAYSFMPGANRTSPFNKNWYFDTAVASPLAEGTSLAVDEYGTSLTSTAQFSTTTSVDEYIRIGSNPGLYLIDTWTSTSALTIQDHFRGSNQAASSFQIRPRGTQILAFCDSVGDDLTPTGVEITYVRNPLPLFRDDDMIELPGYAPAVEIRALQKLLAMMGFNQAADRKKDDYHAALSEMKANEPQDTSICQPTSMFRTRYMRGNSTTGSYVKGLSLINNG